MNNLNFYTKHRLCSRQVQRQKKAESIFKYDVTRLQCYIIPISFGPNYSVADTVVVTVTTVGYVLVTVLLAGRCTQHRSI